jgi:hypothetical protein
LPVFPSYNHFIFNNLAFLGFHGMEEVAGSIPARSTKSFQSLRVIFPGNWSRFAGTIRELIVGTDPGGSILRFRSSNLSTAFLWATRFASISGCA